MKEGGGWATFAERGTLGALWFVAFVYRVLGRRAVRVMLYPIAAYFFLREGSREASRRYLAQVWAHPEGRKHLSGPPGFFAPFWHYHEFAIQIFDRMVLWGRGLTELRLDHSGSEPLFALQREGRGALLIGAHLGSFDMPRQLARDYGLVLTVLMFTANAERINRFFEQLDPNSRIRVLSLEPGSLRTIFAIKACIDRGEHVALLADRVPAGSSETPARIDFLGREMAFPLSPFLLALHARLPRLPRALRKDGRRPLRDDGAPHLRRHEGSAPRAREGRGRGRRGPGCAPSRKPACGIPTSGSTSTTCGRRRRSRERAARRSRELLPQAGPMRLLERVESHDDERTVCRVLPAASTLFRDTAGEVPAWVAIEYMAQCAAAHGGLVARARGEAPRLGLFVGSRRLVFRCAGFAPGVALRVTARHAAGRADSFAFDCSVEDPAGGPPLAEGRLHVVLLDERPQRRA